MINDQTEKKYLTFEEIKAAVKEVPTWKIITGDRSYFTVENEKGYRAYFQLNCWGYHFDNPNYYKSFEVSTVHRPNRMTGSGYGVGEISACAGAEEIIGLINRGLVQSQLKIESGRENFDKRKPSECGRFLV